MFHVLGLEVESDEIGQHFEVLREVFYFLVVADPADLHPVTDCLDVRLMIPAQIPLQNVTYCSAASQIFHNYKRKQN